MSFFNLTEKKKKCHFQKQKLMQMYLFFDIVQFFGNRHINN